MNIVRRWYLYLACAISIQAVCWAIIALLRNLFYDLSADLIALQCAVIIVGFPLFLGHWISAQRLVQKDDDERAAPLRRLYLFAMLASFIAPFIYHLNSFVNKLIDPLFNESVKETIIYHSRGVLPGHSDYITVSVALVVLALFIYFHWRILREDDQVVAETEDNALIRSCYLTIYSAVGLTMTVLALIQLLQWMMINLLPRTNNVINGDDNLAQIISLALAGVLTWIIFWGSAQRRYRRGGEWEQRSLLRKLYLYLILFISVVTAIVNATMLLNYLLRMWLQISVNNNWQTPLSIMLVMVMLWIYQRMLLRSDGEDVADNLPQLNNIRRVYSYLVAAVGLLAFLVGLGGEISLLIQSIDSHQFGDQLREQLAWCTSALLAGLPVWLIPWRNEQRLAASGEEGNAADRRALVRKIYLYFFLLVAVLAGLASLIYLIYQLLAVLFGARTSGNLFVDIAHAVAFSLIAIALWLYHARLLRADNKQSVVDEAALQTRVHLLVINSGILQLDSMLSAMLQREFPQLALWQIQPYSLEEGLLEKIAMADIIIAPSSLFIIGNIAEEQAAFSTAVLNSSAEKLLIPLPNERWHLLGMGATKPDEIMREIKNAINKIINGEQVIPRRSLSPAAIVAIIIGSIILFPPLVGIIVAIFIKLLDNI